MIVFSHTSGTYLDRDGARIYYDTIGDKSKPALLIMHGGFENMENLNSIVSYLANNYYIIGIDSRGHGKSTLGNRPFTYEDLQLDTEAILKKLNINNLSIIGFSDGGIVGYRIAGYKRVKVEKLIAMASSWSLQDVEGNSSRIDAFTPEKVKKILNSDYENYIRLNPEPDYDKFAKWVVDMWQDRSETGHPDSLVEKIEANTLLIRGDNDFLLTLESMGILKNKIANSSLANIPFARHSVHIEQPKMTELIIKEFLSE